MRRSRRGRGVGKGRGEPAAGARETVLSNQAVDASYL